MKGNWNAIVNGYWSPAYPALLGILLSVFRPSAFRELAVIHFINCTILLGALAAFECFMNALLGHVALDSPAGEQQSGPLPAWALRAIGYVLFFWASLYATPPSMDTPDALVLLFVLLAAAILVRIAGGADGWLSYAALGVLLAVSYLAKAAMFPLSFVFMGVSFFAGGSIRRVTPRLLVTLVFFLLVSGPFILALSRSKGRLTFGDAGRIAYAEEVDGISFLIHWQGGPPGAGTPIHPTRNILKTPPVYEFAAPVQGSYPPWADPSYWYDGVRPYFNLGGQIGALRRTFDFYFDLSTRLGAVVAGFLFLLFLNSHSNLFARNFLKMYFLWIPAVSGLGLYSLVYAEVRYLSPFILLLWSALYFALRIPQSDVHRTVARSATIAVVLVLGFQFAWTLGHAAVRLASRTSFPSWEIAKQLRQSGIEPGDKVACIGDSPSGNHYWAHMAGVTIVAEVPDFGVSTFLSSEPGGKVRTLTVLGQTGAKAVVAKDFPSILVGDGWKQIAGTNYSFLLLRK